MMLKTLAIQQKISSIYTGGKVIKHKDSVFSTFEDSIVVSRGADQIKIEGDTELITSFTLTDDKVIMASRSCHIILTTHDGTLLKNIKIHDAPILSMVVDPSQTYLAIGCSDSIVKVYDLERGYITHSLKGHRGLVSFLVFFDMHDGAIGLISGCDDGQIRIWNLMTKECVHCLENHSSVVTGLAIVEEFLVSSSRDKTINVWNWKSGKLVQTIPVFQSVNGMGCLPVDIAEGFESETVCFYGGEKGSICLLDFVKAKEIKTHSVVDQHQINQISFHEETKEFMAVTTDHNILFFDTELTNTKTLVGYNEEVIDAVFVGSSTAEIAVATNSELLRIYDIETNNCTVLKGHSDIIMAVTTSSDGQFIVTGAKDSTSRLWKRAESANEWEIACVLEGHTEAVGAVAITSTHIITASQDKCIKVWNLSSMETEYTIKAHEKDVNSVSVSPNNQFFISTSQDKTAKLWRLSDGQLVGSCVGHKRGVWNSSFSPVDQVVATCSGDKTIKLWNLTDFSCIKTFEGHTSSVLRIHFLASGLQLVSSGSDALIKLWNVKTNECANSFDEHSDKIWAFAMSQDQSMFVSGGADSNIFVWKDYTQTEIEIEKKEYDQKVLQEQELSNFIHRKDFKNAILLALTLEHSVRLHGLFKDVGAENSDKESLTGSLKVDAVVASLNQEQVERLLSYLCDWNTNWKFFSTAQRVLYTVLHFHPLEKLTGVQKKIVDGMIAYTERHYNQLDSLLQKSFISDFTLKQMNMLK